MPQVLVPKVMDYQVETLTEQEKQRVTELLEELPEIGPEELPDWNIRANTFLVFVACKNPQEFLRR